MTDLIYLDYCATTPVHPEVREAVLRTLTEDFGNPSSMHQAGMDAARLLNEARAAVAAGIGGEAEGVCFTSGATEADNLALLGVMRQYAPGEAHLITTAIEHHAVLHTAEALARAGYAVTFLPVDGQGLVDPDDVRDALRPETKLVSVMMVNNEVGSIQPVDAIGALLAERPEVLFHSDAVQGLGFLPVDVRVSRMDLLSLSAHKIYGMKGAGALYLRPGMDLRPLMHGGPQEGALRPGTENVPGIAGLGAAVDLARRHKAEERDRLASLRAGFIEDLREAIPDVRVNGPEQPSPHVLSVSFPGAVAEMMLLHLKAAGVAVSLGSACTSRDLEPSHVLSAMGLPREQIEGTLRLSFGYPTTREELTRVSRLLPEIWRRSKLS
jgi:cysteine desulfurase